jgi:hypothetical protein
MKNILISEQNLKLFIEKSQIPQDKKEFLISALPSMDSEERKSLLKVLMNIRILGLEEEEILRKIRA